MQSDQPNILMCPPDFYGIEYEINPWMDRLRQVDRSLAVKQWNNLHGILEECGAKISLMSPIDGLPDLVFTANSGLVFNRRVILSNFSHPERQGEKEVDRTWFQSQGFQTEELSDTLRFEGAGDALFCGDTLYAGYRQRSDALGHQKIGEMLNCRTVPLELVDPYYYHLDTCFCPLAPGKAVYYPPAFDDYGRRVLRESIDDLIEVREDEARRFACNAVVVGRTVTTNTGCPQLHEELRSRGYRPVETPLDEFVKAGGSAKCLTLRLDGEEAASWRLDSAAETTSL